MPKDLAEMTLEELWQRFPIELVPPRPEWPMMYADESAGLKNRLPADWIVRMEHIGSTAVGTIWAKPIVDILVETTGETDWEVLKTILLDAGYLCMSQSENRMSFNKGYTPQGFAPSVFHLHLRRPGDHDELFFRDYLIDHPEAAQAYQQLKLRLAGPYRFDRDGYTAAKTEMIQKYTQIAKMENQDRPMQKFINNKEK